MRIIPEENTLVLFHVYDTEGTDIDDGERPRLHCRMDTHLVREQLNGHMRLRHEPDHVFELSTHDRGSSHPPMNSGLIDDDPSLGTSTHPHPLALFTHPDAPVDLLLTEVGHAARGQSSLIVLRLEQAGNVDGVIALDLARIPFETDIGAVVPFDAVPLPPTRLTSTLTQLQVKIGLALGYLVVLQQRMEITSTRNHPAGVLPPGDAARCHVDGPGHVAIEPLTDYLRFECVCAYRSNVEAGEDVNILPIGEGSWPEGIPRFDYWLFDSERLVRMNYAPDGTMLTPEPVSEPDELVRANAVRDRALHLATPFSEHEKRFDIDMRPCDEHRESSDHQHRARRS